MHKNADRPEIRKSGSRFDKSPVSNFCFSVTNDLISYIKFSVDNFGNLTLKFQRLRSRRFNVDISKIPENSTVPMNLNTQTIIFRDYRFDFFRQGIKFSTLYKSVDCRTNHFVPSHRILVVRKKISKCFLKLSHLDYRKFIYSVITGLISSIKVNTENFLFFAKKSVEKCQFPSFLGNFISQKVFETSKNIDLTL